MSLPNNPITEGNLRKALIHFFAPIFFSSIVQQSYNIIDALIVGNYAGKEALASVDSTYVIIKLLINVFISVAAGGSIIIAQYYGAKKDEQVRKTVTTLTVFSMLGGVAITIIGTSFTPIFVRWMNVPSDIFDQSVLYLRIYFTGSLFSLFFNINSGVLRAIGDSNRPFRYMLISSFVNIVLDVILVAIFRMDVTGVALATVTAQFVAAFLIGYYMIRSNHSYSICFRLSLYEREKLLLILKTGIPMGVTTVLYAISNMYMQGSINSFGTNGIAAWAICGKLDFLIWVIVDTMGITVTTFMAQNFGAKKFDRMRQVLSNALPLTTFLIGSISMILYFYNPIIAKFFNQDPGVIEAVGGIMSRVAPFYVFYIGGELLSGAIRGRGETFYPMLLTLVGTCLSRIFWIKWIVPKNPSFYLVMWGYPASWIFTTSIFILYYWYFSRRKNNLVHSTN